MHFVKALFVTHAHWQDNQVRFYLIIRGYYWRWGMFYTWEITKFWNFVSFCVKTLHSYINTHCFIWLPTANWMHYLFSSAGDAFKLRMMESLNGTHNRICVKEVDVYGLELNNPTTPSQKVWCPLPDRIFSANHPDRHYYRIPSQNILRQFQP